MRRLAVIATALVALAAAAAPAAAETRLATVVGVTGVLSATADFRGHWDQENYPDEKDACTARLANVRYDLRLQGPGPLVEIDFGVPAAIRPAIETIRGSARLRVTTTATGSAEALSGQFSKFVNCLVETPGFVDDGELASLTGMSPSRCTFRPARYGLRIMGQMLGSVEPNAVRYEDRLLDCGWIPPTGITPSLLGNAKGNWKQQRVFFAEGAPGTTVAVTYRYAHDEADADCPGTSAIITDVCTLKQRGTVTVRYRLGS